MSPVFEKHYCIYCGAECQDYVRIADAVKGHMRLPGSAEVREIMARQPQYIDVCPTHKVQVENALGEKIKRPRRPRVMEGQTTIEDYLR